MAESRHVAEYRSLTQHPRRGPKPSRTIVHTYYTAQVCGWLSNLWSLFGSLLRYSTYDIFGTPGGDHNTWSHGGGQAYHKLKGPPNFLLLRTCNNASALYEPQPRTKAKCRVAVQELKLSHHNSGSGTMLFTMVSELKFLNSHAE